MIAGAFVVAVCCSSSSAAMLMMGGDEEKTTTTTTTPTGPGPAGPTSSFCYRYAADPMRTLFYKSDDCTAKWGWGYDDVNVGTGGEVWVPN
jgi:hypothetical protein